MTPAWRWAGARSIGTSHSRSGKGCEDFAASMEFEVADGNILAAVVSDGAGSASHAAAGSRLVCGGFLRAVGQYLREGGSLRDADDEVVHDWIDATREWINVRCARIGARPRDCAATLVAVLAGPREAVVVHVGDGAAAVREAGSVDWIVPSWPFQGEYASTTTFVTDDPAPRVCVERLPIRLDGLAVFSDGLERMVLDHASRTAFAPFFDRMLSPLSTSGVSGHDRKLSAALREYLSSPTVCDRTDDDKSLVLGIRR